MEVLKCFAAELINMTNMMFIGSSSQNTKSVSQICSVKKMLLEILQNSQRNTCDQSHFFNRVAVFRQRCFPVNFLKFLRTPPVVAYENIILIDLQSKAEIF